VTTHQVHGQNIVSHAQKIGNRPTPQIARARHTLRLAVGLAVLEPGFRAGPVNQVFNLQGPSPSIGVRATVQSGDLPPTSGSVAGAVQAVVFDSANGNVYVGTPGGGIWVSTNGGTNWTPTSDNKASLAIDSLSLDPTESQRKDAHCRHWGDVQREHRRCI
jgi:hypothetical protein